MGGTSSIDTLYALSPDDLDAEIEEAKHKMILMDDIRKAAQSQNITELEAVVHRQKLFGEMDIELPPYLPYWWSAFLIQERGIKVYLEWLYRVKIWQMDALESWSTSKLEMEIEERRRESNYRLYLNWPLTTNRVTYDYEGKTRAPAPWSINIRGQQNRWFNDPVEFKVLDVCAGSDYKQFEKKANVNNTGVWMIESWGAAQILMRALWWVRNTRRAIALTGTGPLHERRWMTKHAIGKYSSGGPSGREATQMEGIINEFITGEKKSKRQSMRRKRQR